MTVEQFELDAMEIKAKKYDELMKQKKMNKNIDLTGATKIARDWIRENRVMNLFYHMFMIEQASKVGYEDKWLVVCSLQEDFKKRTYYVFEISFRGVILKIGVGYKEGNTIKLKEHKLEWVS